MKKEPKNVSDLTAKTESAMSFNIPVKGHMFDKKYSLNEFINVWKTVGFQATNLYKAIEEINSMLGKNPKDNEHATKKEAENKIQDNIKIDTEINIECNKRSKIFFGCTSNMITSGLRDTVCFLAKNKMFDVFVTTAGGIEEDLIKCMADTYIAKFELDGHMLRDNGFNRVGNTVIPNDNYILFESWLTKMLDEIVGEKGTIITPSRLIKFLGEKINNEDSILYWCYKNNIPVYCPAITDGSIGDIITFYRKKDLLKIDIVEDIHKINAEAVFQEKTGVIVLGSGIVKHHILNANLFRNGADNCVLINTANEYDGSDAGATINEAVSWGKLMGKGVKVFGDATILFPLIVAATFALE